MKEIFFLKGERMPNLKMEKKVVYKKKEKWYRVAAFVLMAAYASHYCNYYHYFFALSPLGVSFKCIIVVKMHESQVMESFLLLKTSHPTEDTRGKRPQTLLGKVGRIVAIY